MSDFVRRYGLNWTRADVARRMQLVGGHSYSIRATIADPAAGIACDASDEPIRSGTNQSTSGSLRQ